MSLSLFLLVSRSASAEFLSWLKPKELDFSWVQTLGPILVPQYAEEGARIIALDIKARTPGQPLIGTVELHILPGDSTTAEIEYFIIDENYEGHGIATAAVKKALVYAHTRLKLKYVFAKIHSDHSASEKVLQRNGFSLTDTTDSGLIYRLNLEKPACESSAAGS